jgi:GNAT superfamily N-acetyltransferase
MSIKLLSEDEMDQVQQLAYATWPDTFKNILSEEQIKYMLEWMYDLETLRKQAESGHQFYLYLENSVPLGFIGIEPHHPTVDSLKIHKLYVLPESQGSGVGKKLIAQAEKVAKELGIDKLILNVNRFNKAVEFYKHFGFVVDRQEDIDIGNGYLMEDFVMIYTLRS